MKLAQLFAKIKPMNDTALILKPSPAKLIVRVEIARSFSYKLNVAHYGGNQYESRDFFCSEKAECSIEDQAEVSAALYQFCRAEVLRSVKEYIANLRRQREDAA